MKKIFSFVVLVSILLSICSILEPIYLQNIIDSCTNLDTENTIKFLVLYIIAILGILFFEGLRKILIGKYSADQKRILRNKVIKSMMFNSVKEYNEESSQRYISTLNNDIDMVVDSYYVEILSLTYCILSLIVCIIAMLKLSFIISIIVIATSVFPIIVSTLLGNKVQAKKAFFLNQLKEMNVRIGDFVNCFPMIKANLMEEDYLKVLEKENKDTSKADFNVSCFNSMVEMFIGITAYGGMFLIVVGSVYLILKGQMTIGSLVAILKISDMLTIPSNNIAYEINNIISVKEIKRNLLKNIDNEQSSKCEKVSSDINRIKIKNLSFAYDGKKVLSDVNLTFEIGKKYLILGENGSGKSTLFKILSKFIENYEGEIYINEVELKNYDKSYYDKVGVIFQKVFMFNDTIENNLCLYKEYDLERLRIILKKLKLEKILEENYFKNIYVDTKDNLSGGEKQKVALARLLLQNKKIILLDEATSAIDEESSCLIEKNLLQDKDITLINIEHKVKDEMLELYDEVIYINDGKVSVKRREK